MVEGITNALSLLLLIAPVGALPLVWWQYHKSLAVSDVREWRRSIYLVSLSAASVCTVTCLLLLYCRLEIGQPCSVNGMIFATVSVIVCLVGLVFLIVASGPYRFLLGLCLAWLLALLVNAAGRTSLFVAAFVVPLVLVAAGWTGVVARVDARQVRTTRVLALAFVTVSVGMGNGLLLLRYLSGQVQTYAVPSLGLLASVVGATLGGYTAWRTRSPLDLLLVVVLPVWMCLVWIQVGAGA
jgi:hypothetical protein